VRTQLAESRIVTYEFPSTGGGQGGQERGPWAVVGSNTVLEQGGHRVWGRRYPWGTVSIEDPEHCDFSLLRSLLLARHTLDLVDRTHNLHYETFRCRELSSLAAIDEGKPTIRWAATPGCMMQPVALLLRRTEVYSWCTASGWRWRRRS